MRPLSQFVLLLAITPGFAVRPPVRQGPAQAEVVDRIVARIEDDVITLSEMRELAAYQNLIDNRSDNDDQLRSELIEQWIVNSEAGAAHFPNPADSEVDRELGRIQGQFATPAAFQQRLSVLGLTSQTLRTLVTRQIYFARYLDYKFRSSAQIDDVQVETYYQRQFVPAVEKKGQKVPPLDSVREDIRELLVEKSISDRADTWFDETKSRLNIELEPLGGQGQP